MPYDTSPTIQPTLHRNPAAFTLTELLIVIAILSLLMSILMPSLKKAKHAAKSTKCKSMLHLFSTHLGVYFHEEDEWIPGINTSGFGTLTNSFASDAADRLHQSDVPCQTFDWMTPILTRTTALPANRARKFRLLFDYYKCPAVNFRAVLYDDVPSPDTPLFEAEIESHGKFPGISYLMPAHFQLWGYKRDELLGYSPTGMPLRARTSPPPGGNSWDVLSPYYKSFLEEVGHPGDKIAIADGTRFLTSVQILDFDYSPRPEHFGSFTSAGAWWRGSEAYGDLPPHNSSDGKNIPLSFRHNDGLNALFFDAHVTHLSRPKSRKIDYWYPRGAIIRRHKDGFTDVAQYQTGYVIN